MSRHLVLAPFLVLLLPVLSFASSLRYEYAAPGGNVGVTYLLFNEGSSTERGYYWYADPGQVTLDVVDNGGVSLSFLISVSMDHPEPGMDLSSLGFDYGPVAYTVSGNIPSYRYNSSTGEFTVPGPLAEGEISFLSGGGLKNFPLKLAGETNIRFQSMTDGTMLLYANLWGIFPDSLHVSQVYLSSRVEQVNNAEVSEPSGVFLFALALLFGWYLQEPVKQKHVRNAQGAFI